MFFSKLGVTDRRARWAVTPTQQRCFFYHYYLLSSDKSSFLPVRFYILTHVLHYSSSFGHRYYGVLHILYNNISLYYLVVASFLYSRGCCQPFMSYYRELFSIHPFFVNIIAIYHITWTCCTRDINKGWYRPKATEGNPVCTETNSILQPLRVVPDVAFVSLLPYIYIYLIYNITYHSCRRP